jgi:hypothetical protein
MIDLVEMENGRINFYGDILYLGQIYIYRTK